MRVGMPVYYLVDLLDVAGPFEMLSWAGFDITIAAKQKGRVVCRGGLVIEAETSFDDAPKFDILWVPGGSPESLAERMRDPVFLDFLRAQAAEAKWVCSVCEGALLLAAAGLIDGYTVTTHWAFEQCFADRFPNVKVAPNHPRFVRDRNRLTGGGIASGLDEALELIKLELGEPAAQDTQRTTQYYPRPPVTSQLPSKPPACPLWS
jgi:cyclohexyl-isocyanide hydratase